MEVELSRLAFADIALESTKEATRDRSAPKLDLARVVSLGGPEIVRIALEDIAADDEIRPFVAARSNEFSFHLLHVACTVVPPQDVLLMRVALEFALSRFDPAALPAPLALSMSPEQLDQPIERSRSVSLTAPLKIVDVGIERVRTTVTHDVYLRAMNELRADPRWELSRTESVEIKGLQRFVMVVQTPKEGGQGTLNVRVTAKHRSWGAYRNQTDYESSPAATFTFAG